MQQVSAKVTGRAEIGRSPAARSAGFGRFLPMIDIRSFLSRMARPSCRSQATEAASCQAEITGTTLRFNHRVTTRVMPPTRRCCGSLPLSQCWACSCWSARSVPGRSSRIGPIATMRPSRKSPLRPANSPDCNPGVARPDPLWLSRFLAAKSLARAAAPLSIAPQPRTGREEGQLRHGHGCDFQAMSGAAVLFHISQPDAATRSCPQGAVTC